MELDQSIYLFAQMADIPDYEYEIDDNGEENKQAAPNRYVIMLMMREENRQATAELETTISVSLEIEMAISVKDSKIQIFEPSDSLPNF